MFIRLKYILFVFILSTFGCLSQELVQDEAATEITFKIKNFGFNVDGTFKNIKVSSNFNPIKLKESFINVEIDVKSIFTDSKSRDNHLLKSDFFDVEKHPKIIFKSSSITKLKNSKYKLKGTLLIKKAEKIFEAPLEVFEINNQLIFQAKFNLNRREFDIGGSSFILSKKVIIKMKYVANRN